MFTDFDRAAMARALPEPARRTGPAGPARDQRVVSRVGSYARRALLQQALVDELIVYSAPKLLGQQARPLIAMGELRHLQDAPNFRLVETCQIGEDVRLRVRPQGRRGQGAA